MVTSRKTYYQKTIYCNKLKEKPRSIIITQYPGIDWD